MPVRNVDLVSRTLERLGALARTVDPCAFVIPDAPGMDDSEHVALGTGSDLDGVGFAGLSFSYAPPRRFGWRPVVDQLSTELQVVRDTLSEHLFWLARKPIHVAWFQE